MLKSFISHKRNTSESVKIEPKSKSTLVERYNKSVKTSTKGKSHTLSLVQKSTKKIPGKHTVVEQLNQSQQSIGGVNPFFAFGQRVGGNKNWNIDVDKITQVQDSNSRRQFTSHRSARGPSNCSKQNYNTSNFEQGLRKSTKSRSNKQKSKERSNKSKNQKTKSTISLSRVKNRLKKWKKVLRCCGSAWANYGKIVESRNINLRKITKASTAQNENSNNSNKKSSKSNFRFPSTQKTVRRPIFLFGVDIVSIYNSLIQKKAQYPYQ